MKSRIRFGRLATTSTILLALASLAVPAADLELAAPSQLGLSAARLDRITALFEQQVQSGRLAGAVVALARHGRVGYLQAVGHRDREAQWPMETDTFFRVDSLAKGITSAGVMMLQEDGQLALDDPVVKYVPEFSDPRVLADWAGSRIAEFSKERQPTIHDLLTHPSGHATDALGRVIEALSGLTLAQFAHERFFRPLGMRDTFFDVPPDELPRLARLYAVDERQTLSRAADECDAPAKRLVSTISDYLRFLQMLLEGGALDGTRLLRPDTVARMRQVQVRDGQIPLVGMSDGFGYGLRVLTDRGASADVASVGTFSQSGRFNTSFWVDPQEQFVGILLVQLTGRDQVNLREEFKRLAYQAIDDSGFVRVYWYEPGDEHANPHFNPRQLRVNSPQASVHPEFAARSEPRSSGMARIRIDEDLRQIRRADLYCELWGGHPGTRAKRVSVNGRTQRRFPDVGSADHHCTHQYQAFNLRPMDLVNGYNSLQFACDQGDTFWGHYLVDNTSLQIGMSRQDERLREADLVEFDVSVQAAIREGREVIELQLEGTSPQLAAVAAVHYQGRFFGFDENGNAWRTDWHGMTKGRRAYGMLGSSSEAPFAIAWDTQMLPAQRRVAVRAIVEFKDLSGVVYVTPALGELWIGKPEAVQVTLHESQDLPRPFWSRAGRRQECGIQLDMNPDQILAAELHVVAWTGGAGGVADYFTLNGRPFPVAEGEDHRVVYSRWPVDPGLLRRGRNTLTLLSDTEHHGIEILRPGPTLVVRRRLR